MRRRRSAGNAARLTQPAGALDAARWIAHRRPRARIGSPRLHEGASVTRRIWNHVNGTAFFTVGRLLPRAGSRYVRALAFLAVTGALLPNALTLATGWLLARVEAGAGSGRTAAVVVPLIVVGALYVASNAHGPYFESLAGVLGSRFDTGIRDEVLRKANEPAGIAHLEDPAVADRLRQAEELMHGWLTSAAARGFANVARGRLQATIAGVILATYVWWVPLLVFAVYRIHNRWAIQTGFQYLRRVESNTQGLRRAAYLRDIVCSGTAAKEQRVFGFGPWLIGRYRGHWDEGMQDIWRERVTHQYWLPVVAPMQAFGLTFAVWSVANAAAGPGARLSIAGAVVAIQCVFGMRPFGGVGDGDWQMTVGAKRARDARSLTEVVNRPDSDLRGDRAATAPATAIAFEGVRFHYPGQEREVLRGIDLQIPVGTSLAIVGENGAGKTTMMKLLSRLYDPTLGRITIDGVDLRQIEPRAWRRNVGIIFQDFVRYELSMRDNIGLGAVGREIDDAALRAAAARAGALEIADRVGWDTTLSRRYEGGADLSGGEWQRVALARALFAVEGGARILILDEPTANLDVRAEAELYERFLEITRDVTTIVISHRFSTVRMADRICVIEHGEIVEYGPHDELLARGGRYAEMFTAQASAYVEEAPADA